MKITHVLPALTKGGGERVAAELANQANLSGHEVMIIAAYPVDPAQLRNSLHPNVQVRYVSYNKSSKARIYLSMLPWIWRNRSWLSEQDIIHCHLTYGVALGATVCLLRSLFRLQRPVVIQTYHSVGMAIPMLLRWAHAKMAGRLDALVLMAEDKYWIKFVRNRPKLLSTVILNGISFGRLVHVDYDARRAYRRKIGIPDACRYVVGTIGRLEPDRKPWLYLPIFAEIVNAFGQEVHFVIGGNGSEYDHLCSLVVKYGLEKQVHLPGLIIEPQLPFSITDLYITLNVNAISGVSALEAAYLGVPVLAIQMCSDYKARQDDWIWSSTDLSEIAARATELLRDPFERQALAKRQAAHVQSNYAVESMANSYGMFYKVAVERIRPDLVLRKQQGI